MYSSTESNNVSDASPKGCANCRMRCYSLIDELNPEELAVLEEKRHVLSYKAGETICKLGGRPTGLLCLKEGKVKITKPGLNDLEQIVALKKPVDFIGFRSLMLDQQSEVTATALEDSLVCVIDKDHFLNVVQQNNKLALKVARFFANELNQADDRLINLTQKHIRARMADALLQLLERFGTLADQETLNANLKRADLAALANMTTANAIRVLSSFSQEKLIKTNRREIKIIDIEGLKTISRLG